MSSKLKVNIIMFYCASFIWGAATYFNFNEDSRLNFIFSLIVGILAVQFTVLHASNAGRPIPPWSKWIVFFTWLLSIHVILLYCKGFKGLATSLSHMAIFFVAYLASYFMMSMLFPS